MLPSANDAGQKPGANGGTAVAGGNGKLLAGAPLLAAAFNALTAGVAIIDARGVIVAVNDAWRRHADDNGLCWPRHGIGHSYLAALDSAVQNRDADAARIARGIRRVLAGTTDSYRVESCETPGGGHHAQHITAFEFAGARHALISHENLTGCRVCAEDLRAAEAQRELAENRRRVAEAIADLAATASSDLRLEDALQGMVARIRETVGSQAAAVYSAEGRWDRLVLVAGSSAVGGASPPERTPAPLSVLAKALADSRGQAVSDTGQPAVPCATAISAPQRQPDYRALLVSPIQRGDGLYGYLVLFYGEPRGLNEDDVELADRFGQQVTLALAHAELRSRAEQAAIASERSRLARELHDAVTQTLFSASLVAEALPRVWERDPAEGRRALEDLRLWTHGALAELRGLLMELRPAALIEKPLPDLLRQLSEATATRLCIPVDCRLSATVEPPAEVKLALYRVAQEALNNIVKHANAAHVEIRYSALPAAVQLAILDDGRGFDAEGHPSGQMGLGIMRERVQHIGGKLSIRSAPDAGTEVRVDWRPPDTRPPVRRTGHA